MPIRNLGPCACCQLAAYPVKAVVTEFADATFVGELERKGDTTLVYAYANPMRIEYVVHFSDGSTVNRTFKASKDFDTDNAPPIFTVGVTYFYLQGGIFTCGKAGGFVIFRGVFFLSYKR